MVGLLLLILSFVLISLANASQQLPVPVGPALRSDSIVLVQLGDQKTINYTVRKGVDEEYQEFMTMMRHERYAVSHWHERNLLWQDYDLLNLKFQPVRNRTLTEPAYPITNFHHSHVISRNIRPVILAAEIELGGLVKCDEIIIPTHSEDWNTMRSFIRFASELAGCGSLGISQMPGLQRSVMWAYDLDTTDGLQRGPGPYRHIDRECLLIETEPSHVRLSVINLRAKYVENNCAYMCDRHDASLIDTLELCAAKFKEDCLAYDEVYDDRPRKRVRRANYRILKKVIVSGSPEMQEASIKKTIATYFGTSILDDMSFGVDPEILGAYGAVRLVQIGEQYSDDLRDRELWNEPVFVAEDWSMMPPE